MPSLKSAAPNLRASSGLLSGHALTREPLLFDIFKDSTGRLNG